MDFLRNFFNIFYKKKKSALEETIQTTIAGQDVSLLGASYRYTIPTLTDFLKVNPKSSFARFMLAEILLDKGQVSDARREFMVGQKVEQKYGRESLTSEESKLKKKAKAKLEKKLGYKLK